MDTSSLTMGIILLAIVLLPVIYLSQANKMKNKQILRDQLKGSAESGLSLSEHEIWNNNFLGIDNNQRKLYYVKDMSSNKQAEIIALSAFSKCRAVNSNKTVKNTGGNYSYVDRLELELLPAKAMDKPVKVEIFDSGKNNQLDNELDIMTKWSKIINDNLQ